MHMVLIESVAYLKKGNEQIKLSQAHGVFSVCLAANRFEPSASPFKIKLAG
jgi:hypothetical protein